jgi:hypothetical protein
MASCRCKHRRATPQPAVHRAPPVWIHATSTLTGSLKINQHNAATARARASARLMGTRLQRQSQPISTCGEGGGVAQKHCLPVSCLGYSEFEGTVAASSFCGAGVRNHCGRHGCLWAPWPPSVFDSRRAKPLSMHRFLMAGV